MRRRKSVGSRFVARRREKKAASMMAPAASVGPSSPSVPAVKEMLGWQGALALLALGPLFGVYHMARLWWMEEARKMAGGRG